MAQVVFSEGFGIANFTATGEPVPVTSRTLFGIGSTTKAFTSLLVSDCWGVRLLGVVHVDPS